MRSVRSCSLTISQIATVWHSWVRPRTRLQRRALVEQRDGLGRQDLAVGPRPSLPATAKKPSTTGARGLWHSSFHDEILHDTVLCHTTLFHTMLYHAMFYTYILTHRSIYYILYTVYRTIICYTASYTLH